MIHRHGFPPHTDRDKARATAVAAYRELGGQADEPIVDYVHTDDELLVVVRTEPKQDPPPGPRMGGLVVRRGDIPADLYDALATHLKRNTRRPG